jgi:hypothetical protein
VFWIRIGLKTDLDPDSAFHVITDPDPAINVNTDLDTGFLKTNILPNCFPPSQIVI